MKTSEGRRYLVRIADIVAENLSNDELETLSYILFDKGFWSWEGDARSIRVLNMFRAADSAANLNELLDYLKRQGISSIFPEPPPELADLLSEKIESQVRDDGKGSPSETEQTTPRPTLTLREQRTGYKRIYDLTQKYEQLSPNEQAELSESELADSYVIPMFEALGWYVGPVTALQGEKRISDLQIEYRGIFVAIDVKKPGSLDNSVVQRQWVGGWDWGITTDFETIRIWNLRDQNQPHLHLETGPRRYISDSDNRHEIIAAKVFYERLGQVELAPTSTLEYEKASPATELASQVERRQTSPAQALDRVQEMGDEQMQADTLSNLARYLSESQPWEALSLAQEIEEERPRVQALMALIPRFPEGQTRALLTALSEAEMLQNEELKVHMLIELAPHMPEKLRVEVWAAAQAIREDRWMAEVLIGLAPYFSGEVLTHLSVAARAIKDERWRAEALIGLESYLPSDTRDEALREALEAARVVQNDATRAKMLGKIAMVLPEAQQDEVLKELEDTRTAIQETEAQESERVEIVAHALADGPSEIDLLQFSHYADALTDFIKNENTEKPLTIAIDAGWGMGKTTLMRMIEKRLTQSATGENIEPDDQEKSSLTVWFNAWKYDQEESLWAALALAVLSELKEKLGWWQWAQFWIRLNCKRLDMNTMWSDVAKWISYFFVLFVMGTILYSVAALWIGSFGILKYIVTVGVPSLAIAIFAAAKDLYKQVIRPFDAKLAEYVSKPDYQERVGFIGRFRKDFKSIINSATKNGENPLVIFIDDLDRCAPPKPVEIIEAINILLDAKHCVFILGMDTQSVSASIETKYKDLCTHLKTIGDSESLTLGRRFLEKIVQISFRIPTADSEAIQLLIDANLDKLQQEVKTRPPTEQVQEAEKLIEEERREGATLEEASETVAARPDTDREAVRLAQQEVFARSFDESREVRQALYEAVPQLGFNPRKVKRFINMFRLQALIANRRGLLESGEVELSLLAKTLIISIRWPDMFSGAIIDREFVTKLQEAYDSKSHLTRIQTGSIESDVNEEELESKLRILLTDKRIERLA
jgi:hypothetical protein